MSRRVMVCRGCGLICYKAMLADGSVVWVSHMHEPQNKAGVINCPSPEEVA